MGTIIMLFLFFIVVSLVYSLFIDWIWKENQIDPPVRDESHEKDAHNGRHLLLVWIVNIVRFFFFRRTAG